MKTVAKPESQQFELFSKEEKKLEFKEVLN